MQNNPQTRHIKEICLEFTVKAALCILLTRQQYTEQVPVNKIRKPVQPLIRNIQPYYLIDIA